MRFPSVALLACLLSLSTLSIAADPAAPADQTPAKAPAAVEQPVAAEAGADGAGVGMDDIRAFTAVFSLIKQAYVDPVEDKRLMQGAIRGMLGGLDPHSAYLDEAEMSELQEDTSGSYAGLGIEVLQVDGRLKVVSPIDDTPAARAGIKAGDTIVEIDGKPVMGNDLDDAVDKLRGAAGTTIRLRIVHEGDSTPIDLTVTREVIRVASVRGVMLEPGYAYLRISQFQVDTGNDLRKAIKRLVEHNKGPLKGAVLDLRSNPGGLLNAAVEVSDTVLDSGLIVTTRGRLEDSQLSFRSTPGDLLDGAPLVVLVDNGTASAAEIVAGALKDNHRAVLMGRRTFGKGSVQTVLPLDEEHAVKLTTARYYTPSGISIQAAGITPDIVLADLAVTARDHEPIPMVSERDLRNHLKGVSEGAEGATTRISDLSERDYALGEALNVLKGLALRRAPPATGQDSAKR